MSSSIVWRGSRIPISGYQSRDVHRIYWKYIGTGYYQRRVSEKYCILLDLSMYVNMNDALLWLRLWAKYLINKWDMKRSQAYSCISTWNMWKEIGDLNVPARTWRIYGRKNRDLGETKGFDQVEF